VDSPARTTTPAALPFSCIVSIGDDRSAHGVLRGDLDLANSQLLRDELLTTLGNEIDRLTLDLSGLDFVDSSGIAALVVVRKCAIERDVELAFESVQPQVRRVLEACGVAELFGL
jgi:anti-sigma B factor antagonist